MKELVDMLTRTVGVNDAQAAGGAGVLFKAAKDKLGGAEFDQLLGGLPGIGELIKKAPFADGMPRVSLWHFGLALPRRCAACARRAAGCGA